MVIQGDSNIKELYPTEEGQGRIRRITDLFSQTERELRDILNPSGEASIALTKLEEAYAWAGKAIAVETNQTPEDF